MWACFKLLTGSTCKLTYGLPGIISRRSGDAKNSCCNPIWKLAYTFDGAAIHERLYSAQQATASSFCLRFRAEPSMRRVDHASPIHESDSPGEIVFDSDQEIPHSGSSPRLHLPSALQHRRTNECVTGVS